MFVPALVAVLGLVLFPLVFTLGVSLTNWHLYFPEVQFVGLEMWARPLSDDFLTQTLRNTIVFVLGVIPAQYVIGLVVALALNNVKRGRTFFRVYFLVPMMISPVAIAYIIGRMMMHETFGPVNELLRLAGLPRVPWLSDAFWAMSTLIAIDVWHWTSFMVLMLMAGLQGLPGEIYESAKVDGANGWQSFWGITFPLLAPISVTAVLLRTIDAFKVIDIIKVVTGGGPGRSTESLTMAVLDIGVRGGDLAYGAVMGYVLLAAMLTFSGLLILVTRRWVNAAVG
jgi:multiple sugar transport system permease protein